MTEDSAWRIHPKITLNLVVTQRYPTARRIASILKIVPFPRLEDQSDDPTGRILSDRIKIAGIGSAERDEGMAGVGRGYSPLMGITSINNFSPADVERDVSVNVGDELNFRIRAKKLTQRELKLNRGDVENAAEDINNALANNRAAADDALQIGELFMIGRTVWQVTGRSGGAGGQKVWRLGDEYPDIIVTLKMVEHTGGPATSTIGMAGGAGVGLNRHPESGAVAVTAEGNISNNKSPQSGWCGPTFWPLTKVALAVVRNQRLADTTEIGIKSQVWSKANGLCNFNSLISPGQLEEYESDGNTVQSGTMSQYITRTSVFTIQVREVDNDNENQWQSINEQFCVTGSQPTDQFNFIRIKLLTGPRKLEFRFVPKSGADIAKYSPGDAIFLRLNAKTGNTIGQTVQVNGLGSVRITAVGDYVTVNEITSNPEFSNITN